MSLSTFFGFGAALTSSGSVELPDIFPLSLEQKEFIKIDSLNIFMKILTDVVERTDGLSDEQKLLLWDNCVQSESSKGLITLLSESIAEKKDLFLVYVPGLKIIRIATGEEQVTIRADYAKQGKSKVGVFISFKHYVRADMIKLYSALEYCVVGSLNKQMNLSKAIQLKVEALRSSTALIDSESAKSQGTNMANALARGKDVIMDSKDEIETAKPDITSTKESMAFLDSKRSFYLGLPNSYLTGESAKGLGDSGDADARAIERGLKNYYFAIIKPVLEAVFEIKTTFKSEDFKQIMSSLEALKTFSLVDDTLISAENKLKMINKLFDLGEDAKGDPAPTPDPTIQVPGREPDPKRVNVQ